MTGRTKCVIVNSPANPTGVVASADEMKALADLCKERGVLLISDEVYRAFCYDRPFATPAKWNEDVLVVDGFSKAHGMTGWRLGFAHGPSGLIQEMAKLQQFSFVCAPSMVQHAGVVALDQDLSSQVEAYRRKRNLVVDALAGLYDLALPEGAFYAFPRAPWWTGTEFVAKGIKHNLMTIPGNVFSRRDSHFRISYAVDDTTLRRGLDVLRSIARRAAGCRDVIGATPWRHWPASRHRGYNRQDVVYGLHVRDHRDEFSVQVQRANVRLVHAGGRCGCAASLDRGMELGLVSGKDERVQIMQSCWPAGN